MPKNKETARMFVFTSFQGGVGKSSLAHQFAVAVNKETGKKVMLMEMNLFSPSSLVGLTQDTTINHSFLDYFMTDFVGFVEDDFGEYFTELDGVFMIPFTGIRPDQTLSPSFHFFEGDMGPAVERLLTIGKNLGMYVVVDLPLHMTEMSRYLLHRTDVLFYVFGPQVNSERFARQFQKEVKMLPHGAEKTFMVKNMVDMDSEDEDGSAFPQMSFVPIGEEFTGHGSNKNFHKAIAALAQKTLKVAALGALPFGVEKVDLNEESEEVIQLRAYQREVRQSIVGGLEKRFGLTDIELRKRVGRGIDQAFQTNPPPKVDGRDMQAETKKFLVDEILGLGPLEEFLRDAEVNEIMVNGCDRIFVEKKGRLELTGKTFNNVEHVRTVIERILMPIGRVVNERTPYVDARLKDGSRVHAIIPPLALTGPMLTIRKFSRIPITMEDLVFRFKSLSANSGQFLKLCVEMRRNIVVSGGASSGKTTLLNVLSNFIVGNERVICIEDSAELQLGMVNLGRLEARQQGTEAKNQVTIRDLVRNALRMRPDRIIVGECRGGETLDMLQAMNTGHEGALTTLHANSTRDALARLETMVLMAGVDLPLRAIREQIGSAINIVVQTGRLADGSRKIMEICEVVGLDDTTLKTETIFRFEKKWIGEDGRVIGEIVPTGYIPKFLREMPGDHVERWKSLFEVEK